MIEAEWIGTVQFIQRQIIFPQKSNMGFVELTGSTLKGDTNRIFLYSLISVQSECPHFVLLLFPTLSRISFGFVQ